MSGTSYLKHFSGSFFLFTLLILIMNVLVDPFGTFGVISVQGLNIPKPHAEKNEKLSKSLRLVSIAPEALILGSSRSEFGLDPEHPGFEQYGRAYNLAVAGASPYVVRRFLQHAIAVTDLKAVVLGLDFFGFNIRRPRAPDFTEDYFAVTPAGNWNPGYLLNSLIASTFSLDAVIKSKDTLLNSHLFSGNTINLNTGMRGFAYNGQLISVRELAKTRSHQSHEEAPADADAPSSRKSFANMEKLYMDWVYLPPPTYEFRFEDPDSGRSSFDEFRKIIKLCQTNSIQLMLFISPAHARQLEIIRASNLWPMFEQWKRELVRILAEEKAEAVLEVPLWDFSGYNSITTEPLPAYGFLDHYIDSTHYNVDVGDLVLDRLLHKDGTESEFIDDFGKILLPETIDSVLEKIREEQQHYHSSSLRDVEEIIILKDKSTADLDSVTYSGSGKSMVARIPPATSR